MSTDIFDAGEDAKKETTNAQVMKALGTKYVGLNRYYMPGCCAQCVLTGFPKIVRDKEVILEEVKKNLDYLISTDRKNNEFFFMYHVNLISSQLNAMPELDDILRERGFVRIVSNAYNYEDSIYSYLKVNLHTDGRQEKAGPAHFVTEDVPLVLKKKEAHGTGHGYGLGARSYWDTFSKTGRSFPF